MVGADVGGADAGRRVHEVRHRRLGAAEAIGARQVADGDGVAALEFGVAAEFEGVVAFDPGEARDGIDDAVNVVGAPGRAGDAGAAGR